MLEFALVGVGCDVAVECANALGEGSGFVTTKVAFAVGDLPLQVADVDSVEVY